MIAIYPEIDIREGVEYGLDTITLETALRKFHEGKYYLWLHRSWYHYPKNVYKWQKELLKAEELKKLHLEVYKTMTLGEVDIDIKKVLDQQPLFPLDPDQTPERERVMNKYVKF